MSRTLAFLPLLGLALYSGAALTDCAVAAGLPPSSDIAVNQCESNDDCAGGQCIDNVCHAKNPKLSSVVVTVTPSDSGGTYYFDYPSNGDTNINLPKSVALAGKLLVPHGKDDCVPSFIPESGQTIVPNTSDGAVPAADILFRRNRRVPGLPADLYRVVIGQNLYTFSVSLPADDYDIYIRPLAQPTDTLCPVPPRLLLKQKVTGNLDFKLVAPSKLDVHVVWPKVGSPPVGWTLDLIDPDTGYAISWPRVITYDDVPIEGTSDNTYPVSLSYVPTYGPDAKGVLQPLPDSTIVLRLTPPADPDPTVSSPDDVVAPVILAQLSGAEIGNAAAPAELRLTTALPDKVTVQFDLEHDEMPAAGIVTLTAIDLPGFSELPTAFTRTVTIDQYGTGTVDLLPGQYRVVATPAAACDPTSCLGTTQTIWSIPASPSYQEGKTLQFFESVHVTGRAVLANNAAAVGATVRALASPSIVDFNVMNQGDAKAEVLPRSAFTQVDGQGDFLLGADGGTYDFRVEPNPDTGFAWLVHPQVTIDAATNDEQDLGVLKLPLPIVYKGQLTSGSGDSQIVSPSALIRAYVYLSEAGKVIAAPTDTSVALQVAETHSDSSGEFTLLIPASIDPPP